MTIAMLIIAVCSLLILPGIPAFREWTGKKDSEPLLVRQPPVAGGTSTRSEENDIDVSDIVDFSGNCTSRKRILIRPGTTFERLDGEIIITGTGNPKLEQILEAYPERHTPFVPEAGSRTLGSSIVIRGDLVIPDHHWTEQNFVVHGDVYIGENARFHGSIKSTKSVIVRKNASIRGNLISQADVTIERGVRMEGVVLASENLVIQRGVTLGRIDGRVSVVGRRVELASDITIFGILMSTEWGVVSDRSPALAA
jgi:hypothetical protein